MVWVGNKIVGVYTTKLGYRTIHHVRQSNLWEIMSLVCDGRAFGRGVWNKNVGGEFETTTNSRGQGTLIKVDASEVYHSKVVVQGQGALIKVDASEVSHSKVVVQRTKGNE